MLDRTSSHFRRGFTLTELLISVALALIVLYGVNKVFSTTATTIGVGNALRTANNTLRAVQGNLDSDFNSRLDSSGVEIPGTGILPAIPTAAKCPCAAPSSLSSSRLGLISACATGSRLAHW